MTRSCPNWKTIPLHPDPSRPDRDDPEIARGVMTQKGSPYHIEWRPKARDDLLAIAQELGTGDAASAGRFGQVVRDEMTRLAQQPCLGRVGRPGLPDGVREVALWSDYIVFYRVHSE